MKYLQTASQRGRECGLSYRDHLWKVWSKRPHKGIYYAYIANNLWTCDKAINEAIGKARKCFFMYEVAGAFDGPSQFLKHVLSQFSLTTVKNGSSPNQRPTLAHLWKLLSLLAGSKSGTWLLTLVHVAPWPLNLCITWWPDLCLGHPVVLSVKIQSPQPISNTFFHAIPLPIG